MPDLPRHSKATYRNFESVKACINLFKSSSRKNAFGIGWCKALNNIGIIIEYSPSELCNLFIVFSFQFIQLIASCRQSSRVHYRTLTGSILRKLLCQSLTRNPLEI